VSTPRQVNRREFIRGTASGAGVLVVGLNAAGQVFAADPAVAPQAAQGSVFGVWLRISADDTITYVCPETEMGQGTSSALAQIVAEEFDADFSRLKFVTSSVDPVYANPYFGEVNTGASSAIRVRYMPMRRIGAAARALMVEAAAKRWRTSPRDCHTRSQRVWHLPTGRSISYGALVETAAMLPVPQNAPLKPSKDWTILGKPVKRLDLLDKCTGRAKFAMDAEVPGMVFAHVVHSPVFGGKLRSYDRTSVADHKVIDIVSLGHAVAVVANDPWTARKAGQALGITWDEGPAAPLTTASVKARHLEALRSGKGVTARKEGDVAGALARRDAKIVEAQYLAPYLDHACMEPMVATAWLREGMLEVWSPTQSPARIVTFAHYKYGMPPTKVKIHRTLCGGAFGRRGKIDAEVEAILVSEATGRPVKVIRSREEDIQHGYYRCMHATQMRAALDPSGRLIAIDQVAASQSINDTVADDFVAGGVDRKRIWDDMRASDRYGMYFLPYDFFTVDGTAFNAPYQFESVSVQAVKVDVPVPVGWWRGVGASANVFFTESFIDEAAHAAGIDPVTFRRMHLQGKPRLLAALDTAARAAGWGSPLPRKTMGRGVAICEGFDAYLAVVAQVEVVGKKLRIDKIVAAFDAGLVINPDQAIAQMEGGIVYGLSPALFGEITIDKGRVQQSNFDDYRVMKLAQMPLEFDVRIIESTQPPGSHSEHGAPIIMPALTNAIFAATGIRVRELPLTRQGFEV
jgi:isoquinoline 1-oxidoreductase beta subunit